VSSRAATAALGGLFAAFGACCLGWLRLAPSSTCGCCSCAWVWVYSMPLTLLHGRRAAAKDFLAFTPTPDLPLQMPLLLCCKVDDGPCGYDSDCCDNCCPCFESD
jgi:hypothetical protein